MPEISISDFTDFALKIGQPKITKVEELFRRPEYHPATDYWKLLREMIADYHQGKLTTLSFEHTGASAVKQTRYEEAIKGYKKFLKQISWEWFKPHSGKWSHESLHVRVNPELGLTVDGKQYLIKLYFKQDPLSKSRIQVALSLLREGIKSKEFEVAILDVPRAKLYPQIKPTPQMAALLKGEAATFLSIWELLEKAPKSGPN